MKRNVLIILIIVLILALILGGLYYFDITKTIVHYNYPNISYKIEESDSSIKYTIYTRIDEKTVKCIREYIFENDKYNQFLNPQKKKWSANHHQPR